ncbi:MAG: response regulator transcription factor [Lachnospiraceae bacterium]|nr:response regulator transcription factor [Lachnospiraceae bacterium]
MKVLLAEDEEELSRALAAVLKHENIECDAVFNGQEALERASEGSYDCMIFDVMMPVMDGITALKTLRAQGNLTPVIMLTAKSEIDDRVEGLDAGADDYLTKPFAMKELLARLRSMTRRQGSFTPTTLSLGSVTLDTEEQELSAKNAIRLANKESRLMEYLMLNPGKEISTENIFEHVWKGEEAADIGIVWVYISYLRQKLMSINADIGIEGDKGGSYVLKCYGN